MSRRRNNGNAIQGPHSALTDFLASHNISALQITSDYQQRVQQAAQQAQLDAEAAAAEAAEDKENAAESEDEEDAADRLKRKRKQNKAIAKIKNSKDFKKRKHEHKRDNPGESSDDDALARNMMKKPSKAPPKPGQLANCAVCDKRFTVTPYSLAAEEGGLCCTKCSKEIKDERKKSEAAVKKDKKVVQRARNRQKESDRMMGDVKPGAKSLVDHCVRKVADVVNDIEDFGDLPQNLLDRLSQILSKERVLTSRTVQLFLQPGIDRIAVYDCAKLETEDFQRISAFMPDVERINFRFAGQFKDENLRYMVEKNTKIKHLQLGASNLITDDAWVHLFLTLGHQLESLKLSELNDAMRDETVQVLADRCTNLKRLKLRSCHHMTEASIYAIANMTTLEHLTLCIAPDSSSEALVYLITNLGARLQTLCLEKFQDADDAVLNAIKTHCTRLRKLRLTGSANFSDAAFATLFASDWTNPPIPYIDFNSDRDLDAPMGDDELPQDDEIIGFASAALQAMFSHSGEKLERLDLHSNRQMTTQALMRVFNGRHQYPELKDIDMSFVTHVDEVVVAGMFKSCPALRKLALFGCFYAKDVIVPSGVALIGLPNAQSAVEIIGNT